MREHRNSAEGRYAHSTVQSPVPEFGTRDRERAYVVRPGSYGIVRNAAGAIAVVATPQGEFLPGGGRHADESAKQALIREAREEAGLELHIGKCLGVADEFVYATEEQIYFCKRCTFFMAKLVATGTATAQSHALLWLAPAEAEVRLHHASHRWAVKKSASQAYRRNGDL